MTSAQDTLAQSETPKAAATAGGWTRQWAAEAFGKVPPPVLVVVAIVSIQVGAAFAVRLFDTLGPTGTVFLRVAISALLLMLVWRPAFDRKLRENLGIVLLFGLLLTAMNLFFYQAIARVPLGIAVTVEFLGPLGVALATSRRLPDFLWIGLAVFGVLMLAPQIGDSLDPLGLIYAAIAGACWGSFVLLTPRIAKIFDQGSGLALGMTVAAFCLLPFGISGASAVIDYPLLIFAALAIALLSTTIPFTLEFEALKRMPPRAYGVMITLEPAVAVMVGAILLGDALGWRTLVAVFCVTAAAIGITLCKPKV